MSDPGCAGRAAAAGLHMHGATHPGKERSNNEDAFGIDAAQGIAVVADGMGGLAHGELASRIAVDSILESVRTGDGLHAGFRRAHDRIRDRQGPGLGPRDQMGATAVALISEAPAAHIAWVGDSRAYLWRGGALRQLTRDHSMVQEMLDRGLLNAQEAQAHPYRHVVSRAIGAREVVVEPEMIRIELRAGDRMLLCSDGLSSYLDPGTIAEVFAAGGSDEQVAANLIERTLQGTEAGDNITVVVASAPASARTAT